MSYYFEVVKDDEGLHLKEVSTGPAGMMQHIPNGRFQISGHKTPVGYRGSDSISVQLYETEYSSTGATATVPVDRRTPQDAPALAADG